MATEQKVFYYAQYLLELSLVEVRMLKHSPSLQAASALYLANKLHKVNPPWNDLIREHYTESGVKPCAKDLYTLVMRDSSSLEAVK